MAAKLPDVTRQFFRSFEPQRVHVNDSVTEFTPGCYQLSGSSSENLTSTPCEVTYTEAVDEDNPEVHALCQYQGCKTVEKEFCMFPFRYVPRKVCLQWFE